MDIRTQSRERAVLRAQQHRLEVRVARLADRLRLERSGALSGKSKRSHVVNPRADEDAPN